MTRKVREARAFTTMKRIMVFCGTVLLFGKRIKRPTMMERLGIEVVTGREDGGAWVYGELGLFEYMALVFPQPPYECIRELRNSRITEMAIRSITDNSILVCYSGDWKVHPATFEALKIVRLLKRELADAVFPGGATRG